MVWAHTSSFCHRCQSDHNPSGILSSSSPTSVISLDSATSKGTWAEWELFTIWTNSPPSQTTTVTCRANLTQAVTPPRLEKTVNNIPNPQNLARRPFAKMVSARLLSAPTESAKNWRSQSASSGKSRMLSINTRSLMPKEMDSPLTRFLSP